MATQGLQHSAPTAVLDAVAGRIVALLAAAVLLAATAWLAGGDLARLGSISAHLEPGGMSKLRLSAAQTQVE